MYTHDQIKQYLAPNIIENLVCVFKTGSQLFCQNCKDHDYVIITSADVGLLCFHVNELKADFFVMSIDILNQKLQDNQWRYKLSVCLAKTNSENIIYGKLPELDIDISSREYLLKILKIEYAFAEKTYFVGKGASKTIVWGLGLYYAIINGNLEYTEEQKVILQQCHDSHLDDSRITHLKNEMERLLGEI